MCHQKFDISVSTNQTHYFTQSITKRHISAAKYNNINNRNNKQTIQKAKEF